MSEFNALQSVLERLAADTHSNADVQTLRLALQAGQVVLATRERAVAVGGDVTDAVITTGDGNVLCIFKGPDAEAVRKIVQQTLNSSTLRTFHDPVHRLQEHGREILGIIQDAIASHIHIPRTDCEQRLSTLVDQHRFVLVTGTAGIGKSALVLLQDRVWGNVVFCVACDIPR